MKVQLPQITCVVKYSTYEARNSVCCVCELNEVTVKVLNELNLNSCIDHLMLKARWDLAGLTGTCN